jgi:hypothetical protein
MTTLRAHFTFRVDTWTPDGESVVEYLAGVEDYQVALVARRVNAGPARPSLCDRARRLRVVVGRRPSSKIVGGNSWPSLLSSLRPVLCAPKSALPSRSFCVFVHCQCAILDLKFTMGFAAKPDTIKQADVDCFSL